MYILYVVNDTDATHTRINFVQVHDKMAYLGVQVNYKGWQC